jgi:two-component system cell cycle response regulator
MKNKKTILIVDDVQLDINIQKEFLKYSQVRILTANDGLEALKILKIILPDLIVMDLYMPNMDGFKCTEMIKTNTELTHIPIIMITGGNDIEKDRKFLTLCDDYLAKPLNKKIYLSKASKYVSGIKLEEKRKECNVNAHLKANNISTICSLTNICMRGVYVTSDCHVSPSDVIHISFLLPDGTQINCNCKIVWVNRSTTQVPIGFGAEFVLLPRNAKEALKKFIFIEE